ncbi:MAG: hypothetical protein DIU65_01925 [Proteobacteria bacterium]|nr:MAG: hypothetical protein DIU65_01925 [Pseudomonadota bacterium]
MIRTLYRASLAAATLALLAPPAFAHVTLESQEAVIGSEYKAVLKIPHGCGEEATSVVRVQIPEGFFNAKPQPKAGWILETITGPYEKAYDNHGTVVTEGVREIIWSGGNLPSGWYEEFVFRGTFADSLAEGDFVFPTVQECASGEEAWIEIDAGEDARRPAPRVRLVPRDVGQ